MDPGEEAPMLKTLIRSYTVGKEGDLPDDDLPL